MMPARLLDEARDELQAAALYYEEQQAGLGDRFVAAFREAARRIQSFPNAWGLVSKRSRRCRLKRFPYGLVYQIVGEEILILAVMHLHRKPDYWRGREQE